MIKEDDGLLYTWGRNGKYECGQGHGDDVISCFLTELIGFGAHVGEYSPGLPSQEGCLR